MNKIMQYDSAYIYTLFCNGEKKPAEAGLWLLVWLAYLLALTAQFR